MIPYLLIIDDSDDQLLLLKNIYSMVDPSLEIITSNSGPSAIKMMKNQLGNLPKVILLDFRMPEKSGLEVLAELKSDIDLKRIPVCVYSHADLDKDICDSYERGASFFFKKPSGLEEIKNFLEHFNMIWFKFASQCGH